MNSYSPKDMPFISLDSFLRKKAIFVKNCRKFSLHFQGAPKVYLEETTFYFLARVIIGTSLYRTLLSVCLSVFREEPALIFPSDILALEL